MYKTNISLVEYSSYFIDTLLYTNALIRKTNNPIFTNKKICNYDNDYCFNLELNPNTIGWNFFYAEVVVMNHKTGYVSRYPITDSFYVYK